MSRAADLWDKIIMASILIAVTVVVAGLLSLLSAIGYFAATGGLWETKHERIGGIECVVVQNRLTGSVKDVSCPPIQTPR